MSALLYRLGALCVRRKFVVLGLWVLALVLVGAGVARFGMRTTDDIRLPGTGTQQASNLLKREFPSQQNGSSPIVFHTATGRLTDPARKRAVMASLTDIAEQPHVRSVVSPFSRAGATLLSKDEKTAVAQVALDVNGLQLNKELARRIYAAADPARRAGLQVEAGGAVGATLSQDNSRRSEMIGVGAAIVILAFTFGAMVAAGLPVVTALIGLVIGLGLVGLLGHVIDIPTVAPKLATMIGLGVGIDYALFIVFRHRDQLHEGMPVAESVARAIATSGTAVLFAGATVVISLLALLVANVPILGAMGYAAALTVVVAIAVAITLVPALLAIAGTRLDALRLPGRGRATRAHGRPSLWARWAGAVTRHPWVWLVAALLVLAPLMAPTLTLRLGQEDIGVTPTSQTQRRAFDLISAGLGPGANGPLLIAARLTPAAQASYSYTTKYEEAQALKRTITKGKKKLAREGATLKRRGAQLAAEQAGLQTQTAVLRARANTVAAQGATLQGEQAALLRRKARLTKLQASLTAKGDRLAAEGAVLQGQIADLQQQLAAATDPAVIAQLQVRLAARAQQAQEVQKQLADLQRQGTVLAKQGKTLQAQGDALAARGAALAAQGNQVAAEGSRLAARGNALKARGASLKKASARLSRRERKLKRKGRRAQALKNDLTRMLTKAGGQATATDPRVVRLQDALGATPGVVSVSPPRVNKAGTAAVLSVTAATRPADPKTVNLVNQLRDSVLPAATRGDGVTTYVGGVTSAYVDLASLIAGRLPLVIATVLALSFVLLMIAFRSLLVPLKAVICNLLAVAASFGVLTVVFQWGWGLRAVGLANPYGTVPIASYVPLLMFAVLFGLSTDYEVFLISQIFQSHAAGESPADAVRSGVGTSARVITAAAVIMVTVFASFILTDDPVIKQFGVGLSLAIILDTTIVRLVIVPSTMVLLGEWNWYLPRWLQWLPRMELPKEGPEPEKANGVVPAAAGNLRPESHL